MLSSMQNIIEYIYFFKYHKKVEILSVQEDSCFKEKKSCLQRKHWENSPSIAY